MEPIPSQVSCAAHSNNSLLIPVMLVTGRDKEALTRIINRLIRFAGKTGTDILAVRFNGIAEVPVHDLVEAISSEIEHAPSRLIVEIPSSFACATATALFQPHPDAPGRLFQKAFVQTVIAIVNAESFIKTFFDNENVSWDESESLLEQVENANCILLETSDDAVLNNRAVELITLLNPSAELFRSGDSEAFEQCVLEKPGLQNWIAKGGSGWLRLLVARGTSASSTGFVFRSRLPFHPQRLWEALDGPLRDIFRMKGLFWIASRMSSVGMLDRVGVHNFTRFEGTWWASIPREKWPGNLTIRASIERSWEGPFGDRRQEIAIIDPTLDRAACEQVLNSCLLSSDELLEGTDKWLNIPNPFNPRTFERPKNQWSE
jgi:G3E family GTPase